MESNKETKKVFVLNVTTPDGKREAIIAESATWCRVMPGVVERFIKIEGRMTDQETAHRWFDGRDIDLRDSQRDDRYKASTWKSYWRKRPLRTYQVPASSLAYVEELIDASMDLEKPFAKPDESQPRSNASAA